MQIRLVSILSDIYDLLGDIKMDVIVESLISEQTDLAILTCQVAIILLTKFLKEFQYYWHNGHLGHDNGRN